MTYEEFRKNTLKTNTKKVFKVRNSYTMKSIWRWLRKNKWADLRQPITELQLGTIVKRINQYYQDRILEGHTVRFPHHMGELYLKKSILKPFFKNDKLVVPNAVDWKATLKEWYDDSTMKDSGKVVRYDTKDRYSVKYSKKKAAYNNMLFFRFVTSRTLKAKLREKIDKGLMPF